MVEEWKGREASGVRGLRQRVSDFAEGSATKRAKSTVQARRLPGLRAMGQPARLSQLLSSGTGERRLLALCIWSDAVDGWPKEQRQREEQVYGRILELEISVEL